jgi:hypothetical protein
MAKFDEVYMWIAKQLAVYLDKFKVKNPVLYVVLEGFFGTMATLVGGDAIDIPNIQFLVSLSEDLTTDKIVVGLLLAVMAALSPRTTVLKNLADAEKVQAKA